MTKKIKIDNQELLVLLEIVDMEYEKIIICLDKNDKKIFVINNRIVKDERIIEEINTKYDLELPDELKGIIF